MDLPVTIEPIQISDSVNPLTLLSVYGSKVNSLVFLYVRDQEGKDFHIMYRSFNPISMTVIDATFEEITNKAIQNAIVISHNDYLKSIIQSAKDAPGYASDLEKEIYEKMNSFLIDDKSILKEERG